MNPEQEVIKGTNPILAIAIAVAIAAAMVVSTTLIFLQSGAYDTVKQIQAGAKVVENYDEDIDSTSPIKAEDIDNYAQDIKSRIQILDDNSDFGASQLSDSNLGL